jgi:copper homeostasis protein
MPSPHARRHLTLEVCTESVADVLAAQAGGADRAELCADLVEGGTTPSAGAIALAVQRAAIPVMVMVRPRGGDFLYDELELEVMARDIDVARRAGAQGVVLGCLTADAEVDAVQTERLVAAARPMEVTFHRAFDMVRDPHAALETLIELGVDRVLTSGQQRSVADGLELVAALVARAGRRIGVMPGCGIDPSNILEVAARTGARELHFTAFASRGSGMVFRNPRPLMGAGPAPGEYERRGTDQAEVRRHVDALGELR